MKKSNIKSKLISSDKKNHIYSFELYTKKDRQVLGKIVFTKVQDICDFNCKLEKEEYYEEIFLEVFLNIINRIFKYGYKGVTTTPSTRFEEDVLIKFGFIQKDNNVYYLESRDEYKVKINEDNHKDFQELYSSMINDERLLRMREISQHRGSNSYEHSLKVTRLAYRISRGLKIKADYRSLIRASLLHDYFLYDWRKERERLHGHGHNHPYIAVENADRDFSLNYLEKLIIIDHMWPINILNFPKSWEAKIVSYADKVVSTWEALTWKGFKDHFRDKTLKKLQLL